MPRMTPEAARKPEFWWQKAEECQVCRLSDEAALTLPVRGLDVAAGADPVWRHLAAQAVDHLKAVGVNHQHLRVVAVAQQAHRVA